MIQDLDLTLEVSIQFFETTKNRSSIDQFP